MQAQIPAAGTPPVHGGASINLTTLLETGGKGLKIDGGALLNIDDEEGLSEDDLAQFQSLKSQ
eukprot:11544546-Prorocentrum_lima.AAC.1